MKIKIIGLLVITCLGLHSISSESFANIESTFYVSTSGNDAWSGKFSEPNANNTDGPLATLNAARLKVRETISNGKCISISVLIRGGEYKLDETVVFDHNDSGNENCPIFYSAYPGEAPVFTGGKKLKNWKKCENPPAGTPQNAKGNLWYCDITNEHKEKWQITSLYNGNKMLPRSKSGKLEVSDDHVPDSYNVQPKNFKIKDWDGNPLIFSRDFKFNGSDLKNWSVPSDIEILISPKHDWLINLLPLEDIDTENNMAHLAIDPTYTPMPNDAYYIENAMEYLDAPGEWVFKSDEGRIYIWPESPLENADIRAPFLQEFIRVEGIEDSKLTKSIHFEGLTFMHGLRDSWEKGDKGLQHDWDMYDKGNAVLRFRHAEDCSVKACTFTTSSGDGVRLDLHCQHINISDNVFSYLGGTGILLSGYAPGSKDENKFNTISNNYIHHVGTIYTHAPGIFIAQSGHNLISHNTIHDLGYNGMVISGCRPKFITLHEIIKNRREWVSSLRMDEIEAQLKMEITPETSLTIDDLEPLFHARENQISDNEIYSVMQKLHDGNAIYFSGMGLNNIAERNYLHDISGDRGNIRLDDHSAYTTIINNVGLRTSMMFVMKGPAEFRNNFAINCGRMTNKRWAETQLDQIIFYSDNDNTGNVDNKDNYIFDDFERISNSLIFGGKSLKDVKPGQDMIPAERRGSAEVGLMVANPMFDEEAFDQKIFRFKEGSPALELGIQPIDLSKVGSSLAK
jgi:hypothetical protein